MIRKITEIAVPLLFFCAIVGGIGTCVNYESKKANTFIEKSETVARVFMHSPGEYSFLVAQPGSQELLTRAFPHGTANARIITDVPPGKDMSATYSVDGNGNLKKLEIHIHSVKDINGAGWDNGKFGSGMTTVVE